MPDKNKKTFESIFTKTRVYLVVIGIVLIILCLQNILFIAPSIILYGLLIGYTFWTNSKNKTELDKHIQELTFNVDTIAKNALINSPFPLVIAEADGEITWKSASFVTEFGNTDIKSIITEMVKETIQELENGEKKTEKSMIYRQSRIGKKDYKVIIEAIEAKTKNRKKNLGVKLAIYFIDNTAFLDISKG